MIALFGMMAIYGPSFELGGQFRYIEVLLVAIFILSINTVFRDLDSITRLLIPLFLLTAISQIISDLYNNVPLGSTIGRVGTFVLFVIVLVTVKRLANNDFGRMRWMLFGYALSWVFIYFVGTDAAPNYPDSPWRLGLGWAATMAVCLVITLQPRLNIVSGLLLLGMSLVHIILGSRSIAIFALFASAVTFWTIFSGADRPATLQWRKIATVSVILIFGIVLGYQALLSATEKSLFPDEVQQRMQAQVSSPYGLAATSRPETAAALKAIAKRPIIGFGSKAYDNEIWGYYIDVLNSNYLSYGNYTAIYKDSFYQEWDAGLPSHSHLFGAWVDAGFFAILSWLAVLVLAFYAILSSITWRNTLTPLIIFIGSTTIWDVLFSPGPHRMDMALRIMILTYAVQLIRNQSVQPPVAHTRHRKRVRSYRKSFHRR
ncbi:hypothetical protein [Parasphingorhabdus sp.]|uniref:hypothetical protein n=1 Tax=Parasphingorhabdus sp. TaxID=2709688 RepID=UPI003001B5C1